MSCQQGGVDMWNNWSKFNVNVFSWNDLNILNFLFGLGVCDFLTIPRKHVNLVQMFHLFSLSLTCHCM